MSKIETGGPAFLVSTRPLESELQDTCHNQAQRIAELEKDAARYNWLIQQEAWEPSRETLPKWYGGKIKWLGGEIRSCNSCVVR